MSNEGVRRTLFVCGCVLLAAACTSYALRMALYPAERWSGGAGWSAALAAAAIGLLRISRTSRAAPRLSRQWTLERISVTAFFSLLIAAAFALWLAAQLAPSFMARRAGIRRPQYAVEYQLGVRIRGVEGTPLNLDLYHPRNAGKVPTIVVPTALAYTAANRIWAWNTGRLWAERGYHTVFLGLRGRWNSDGVYRPLLQEHLRDVKLALAWLSQQNWFDGRVGIMGEGAGGHAAWAAADDADIAATLHVTMAATDNYEMFYPGGVFSLQSALYWAMRSRGSKDVDATAFRLQRGAERLPMRDADAAAGGDTDIFNDWVTHSQRDDYWKALDRRSAIGKLRRPAMLVAGWYDPWLRAQLNDWERIQLEAPPEVAAGSRLIIGPWGHLRTLMFPGGKLGPDVQRTILASRVEWFDHQFHNSGKQPLPAPVRYFVMGRNEWREAPAWPPPEVRELTLYLHSGGRAHTAGGDGWLAPEPPLAEQPPDIFDFNPRQPVPSAGGAVLGPYSGIALQNDIEKRADVLVYTGPVLERDLEIAGPVRAVLHVATFAPTTDFTAKLVDVRADGSTHNVSEGIVRRRYFDSNKPEGWSPITEIVVELFPTAMVFLRGHRVRLEVSSSNHPRFARNHNTGGDPATETHTEAVRQAVWHGAATPSRLVLPESR